jgi:hypothetical protein
MPRSHSRTMSNLRLQRRHYKLISDIIRYYQESASDVLTLPEAFAAELAGTNPGFDRNRFIAACGNPPTPTPKCLLCQSEQR